MFVLTCVGGALDSESRAWCLEVSVVEMTKKWQGGIGLLLFPRSPLNGLLVPLAFRQGPTVSEPTLQCFSAP